MKGFVRSIVYWFYNLEKVFAAMLAVIAAVMLMNVLINGSAAGLADLLKMYLPIIGAIFPVSIMISVSTNSIPQSLSLGATRKEVFAGMECMLHIIACQTLLLAVLLNAVLPERIFEGEFIVLSAVLYLAFMGTGNAMCAGSLKYGARGAMVLYIIIVLGVCSTAGIMGAVMSINEWSLYSISKLAADYWIAAVLFDLLMAVVCYRVMRNYEVRV